MGSGAFGSNGSVHWKVVHTADQKDGGFVHGRDPNTKGGPVNTKGTFRVKLRFTDDAEARNVLTAAAGASRNGTVYVLVPARKRQTETDDLPWEIEIDW
jgi:prophage tail gpP-like protein